MPKTRRSITRWFAVAILSLVSTGHLVAQASPYLPLDDPRVPLIEHLIARGDIRDPSPLIRPLRRSDILRALTEATLDSTSANGRLVARLRRELAEPGTKQWWSVAPRAGVQSFTHARRDLLQPGGDGGTRPYVEAEFSAGLGPFVLVSRAAADNRLNRDPDWRGSADQADKKVAYRFIEAYTSAQFHWGSIQFGQIDRNWGPVGVPGIGLSNSGYPRTDFSFDVGPRTLRFRVVATQLRDETDAQNQLVHRYFVTHRLDVRPAPNLTLALWETNVVAGPGLQFEPATLNPLLLFAFASQFGQESHRNAMIGGDGQWRPTPRLLLEGQLVLDDYRLGNRDETPRPNRWAFTAAASGPAGGTAGWRASYTAVSSLAFRTSNPMENYVDAGVGIGRNFADNGRLSLAVTVPVRGSWLVTPELELLSQGEGRIDEPFPVGSALTATPEWLIGTVRSTWRMGLGLSGVAGPLRLSAVTGYHHTTNAEHQQGRTENRFEGRVLATIGFRIRHALPAN